MVNFTEEEQVLIIEGLLTIKKGVHDKFQFTQFVDQEKVDQYFNQIDSIIEKVSNTEVKKKKKVLYNVNVGEDRLEQFESLEDAKENIERRKNDLYLTKSVYKWDEECEEWDEVVEFNINEQLDENFERVNK